MSSTSVLPQPGGVPSSSKYDLFIVHSAADRPWVDGYLKHALGLDPARVLTPGDFRLGESVAAEFERGVTTSRFTLLVLSSSFLADRWSEFGEGLVSFSTVDEGRNRLLALTLHACEAPLRLRFRESLDCTDWTRWDDEAARLRRHLDAPEPVREEIACPYPGMVPFREQDARFFHGRDDEIQSLVAAVRHHHFLLVIGSSGSGKSSLVKAGLLPKLKEPKHFPRGTWRVLTMRPGATPIDELSRILAGVLDDPAASITATLAVDPSAQRLLLFVDQFEELFSQVKEAATRDAFLDRLKALRADSRCTVILTMRADFYGDLMNSALWPIDRSQIVEIVPLRGEALRQAIVKPAETAGVFLDEGLVERLISDAANEPGSLPMLQEALVLLWGTMSGRLLTRASYDTLGHDGRSGLAVAMATKADATLVALPPEQQRIARRIFLRLVQFGEGRPDTRRQLAVDDLRAAGDDPHTFDGVLERLTENRLLTPSVDEDRGLRLDIAHEMLIVGWPASREWVEVRRNAEKTRRRLVVKAEEWVRLGRGEAGLLDPGELVEADAWLPSPDAADLGIDPDVRDLAVESRQAIESWKRRKRMWTRVGIGGLITALIAISAFAVWGELNRRDALQARDKAKANAAEAVLARKQAEKNADEAKANAAEVLIGAGSTALASGHSFDAMHRFALAIKTLPDSSPLRGVMSPSLGFLAREVPRLESILEHAGPVNSAAFSPDGARVVTASSWAWHTSSDDKTARVWNAADGTLIAELKGHAGRVNSAAFSSDGKRVVTASEDTTARVWNAADGTPIAELKGHTGWVYSAAFSSDGKWVVTASDDKTARVWNAADTTLIAELKGHANGVRSAAFSSDGKWVVTASDDKTARVWNADGKTADGKTIAKLKGHAAKVFSAAFSPDGARVVTASWDETARVWNAADWTPIAELKGHTGWVDSAAFSSDSKRVVTASRDKTARVWNATNGKPIAELKGHTGWVDSAAFSSDGKWVVTASEDQTARVWNAADGTPIAELKGHTGRVYSAAFSPDGARVVTASEDKTARVWNAADATLIAELKGHAGPVNSAAFSSDGKWVVIVSEDKTAQVWNAADGTLIAELKGHAGPVNSAAFSSPDGARVVTASRDKTARVWNAADATLIAELKGHMCWVNSAAFSSDGARVVTASEDKTARVWNAANGKTIAELKGHTYGVNSAAFGRDGARVVTASKDQTARVWNAADGTPIAELKGHTGWVYSAAFSPDGARVVTASEDKTARVWNAADTTLIAELKGHAKGVRSAAFSSDGKWVVTASEDKTARVWYAADATLIAELKGHANGVFSAAFSPDGARVVTASWDQTARVWRFEAVPGDASTLPLWIEVLTGTKMKGKVVQPLPPSDWKKRKDQLDAKDKQGVLARWFEKPKAMINLSTSPVKK